MNFITNSGVILQEWRTVGSCQNC